MALSVLLKCLFPLLLYFSSVPGKSFIAYVHIDVTFHSSAYSCTDTDSLCVCERIHCPISENCNDQEIRCSETINDSQCIVQCTETESCRRSTVICAANKNCTVNCLADKACQYMQIYCPAENAFCSVKAQRAYSFHNGHMYCSGSYCNATCNGIASCYNATMYGDQSGAELAIFCNDNARDQASSERNFACKNMNIYCSEHDDRKHCKMSSISTASQETPHTDLRIHAVNSWSDIDLSAYTTNIASSSKMYCGEDLTDSCSMANVSKLSQWNCLNESSPCYVQYASNETEEDKVPLIIGICVGAFFLILICFCIVLCCKKDEEQFEENTRGRNKKEKDIDIGKNKEETDKLKGPQSHSYVVSVDDEDEEESKQAERDVNSEDFKQYKDMMSTIFYTFAGYQPWAKKTGLYMQKKELQTFLDIVHIEDPVEDVLRLLDAKIADGKVTYTEWMEYWCDVTINEHVFVIKEHIESQVTWDLLCKALRIIQEMDKDHTGKLEYGEFAQFGESIGLNSEETEVLFNTMDTDDSGSINIVELFEWLRLQLHRQRGRLEADRQPSLMVCSSDLEDLKDFTSNARSMSIASIAQDNMTKQ